MGRYAPTGQIDQPNITFDVTPSPLLQDVDGFDELSSNMIERTLPMLDIQCNVVTEDVCGTSTRICGRDSWELAITMCAAVENIIGSGVIADHNGDKESHTRSCKRKLDI